MEFILARTILKAPNPVIQAASLRCSIAVDQQKAEVQCTAAQGQCALHRKISHSHAVAEEWGVAFMMRVTPLVRPSDGPSWTYVSGHSRASHVIRGCIRASAARLILRSTKWQRSNSVWQVSSSIAQVSAARQNSDLRPRIHQICHQLITFETCNPTFLVTNILDLHSWVANKALDTLGVKTLIFEMQSLARQQLRTPGHIQSTPVVKSLRSARPFCKAMATADNSRNEPCATFALG